MKIFSPSRATSLSFGIGILFGVIGTTGAASLLGSDVFSDVPRGSYYDAAVGEMNAIGVIKGSDGIFRPGDAVSRADVAVMLKRLRDEMMDTVSSSSRSSASSKSSSSTVSSSSSSASSSASVNLKGSLRFTTNEIRVPENVSTKKVTVAIVRTGGAEGTITIEYATSGGTASEGTDYVKAGGVLTFVNKETSKTFDIPIKDDSLSEGSETVTITLSNPGGGASLGTPSTLTLIITDNEAGSSSSTSSTTTSTSSTGPSVGFGATQYSVDEDMPTITITVVRAGSSSSSAAVTYATSNGTGKSGNEYTATTGTLSFAANESSKTFTVPIFNDTAGDGAKTFTVTLSAPTGGSLTSGQSVATVTINDDETVEFGSGSFKFSKSTYNVDESSGKATITVQRTGGSAFTASVNYTTNSLSAISGSDFTSTAGTLTFAPGEAAKNIAIPIVKDTIADTGETFSVDLSGATGNVPLISPYSTTVTID